MIDNHLTNRKLPKVLSYLKVFQNSTNAPVSHILNFQTFLQINFTSKFVTLLVLFIIEFLSIISEFFYNLHSLEYKAIAKNK